MLVPIHCSSAKDTSGEVVLFLSLPKPQDLVLQNKQHRAYCWGLNFFLLQKSVPLPLTSCFHEELKKKGLSCCLFLLICIICVFKLLPSLLFLEVSFKSKRLWGSNLYMETTCVYEPLKELQPSNGNKASFGWKCSFVANLCRHFGAPDWFIRKEETFAAESRRAKVSFVKGKKFCAMSWAFTF